MTAEDQAATNVVALENRKSKWTPEECLAVALRRNPVRVMIVVESADGQSSVLSSDMTRKDQLWLAEQARMAATHL